MTCIEKFTFFILGAAALSGLGLFFYGLILTIVMKQSALYLILYGVAIFTMSFMGFCCCINPDMCMRTFAVVLVLLISTQMASGVIIFHSFRENSDYDMACRGNEKSVFVVSDNSTPSNHSQNCTNNSDLKVDEDSLPSRCYLNDTMSCDHTVSKPSCKLNCGVLMEVVQAVGFVIVIAGVVELLGVIFAWSLSHTTTDESRRQSFA